MSSKRATALATACLRSRPSSQPQQLHRSLSYAHTPAYRPAGPRPFFLTTRQKHTIPRPPPRTSSPAAAPAAPALSSSSSPTTTNATEATEPSEQPRSPPPQYELTFTCVPCGTRSKHKVSKQGYHHGSVLIACPGCKNRHVISDHLKIFGDRKITIEDLLREKGQLVKRGTLGEEGDLEFWDDGSTTARGAGDGSDVKTAGSDQRKEEGWKEDAPGTTFRNKAESETAA